jgi:hypothetical protein
MASPYSLYERGRDVAHRHACRIAARQRAAGYCVYSPIVHGHCLAAHMQSPGDTEFWLAQERPMMDAACGIMIAMMPGWESSVGVAAELAIFREARKTVMWVVPTEEELR